MVNELLFKVVKVTHVVTVNKFGDEVEYYRYSLQNDYQTSMSLRLPEEKYSVGQEIKLISE